MRPPVLLPAFPLLLDFFRLSIATLNEKVRRDTRCLILYSVLFFTAEMDRCGARHIVALNDLRFFSGNFSASHGRISKLGLFFPRSDGRSASERFNHTEYAGFASNIQSPIPKKQFRLILAQICF